jgi:soluble lytic murein transglycosylase
MNQIIRTTCIISLVLSSCASASPRPSYFNRFMHYLAWSKQLPTTPSPAFLAFISGDEPLSEKLREKWLYSLAKDKNWKTYTQYYQPTDNISLQCYQQFARHEQHQSVIHEAEKIWLTGKSLPPACDALFNALSREKKLTRTLMLKRVNLALENRNPNLAKYLIARAGFPNTDEKRTLDLIQRQPTRIAALNASNLHGNYYLYGLKRLVASNPKRAIELWYTPKTKKILSKAQQQDFLSHLALYRALRNKPDAYAWFLKITPNAYSESLIEWQIRFAIRNQQWAHVKTLIQHSTKQEESAWQYWLARAEAGLGHPAAARTIYQTLAESRHYYGFLASHHLKQAFAFESEAASHENVLPAAYAPITENIKDLYVHHKHLEASRMANDFASELPKSQKSAFVAWLARSLHWTGKSVYLSGDKQLHNQIKLRFPVAHQASIKKYAALYHIPEALIYAVIRQESAFRQDVVSPVGAYGLMQIMPKTAKQIARKKQIPYRGTRDLSIPDKNIQIGVAYLGELAKQYDHNPVLMIAAYNAGPRQVNHWLKAYPIDSLDSWIDCLSWGETRNYLKSVMAFYAVYQYRLNSHKSANLDIFFHQDIKYSHRHKDFAKAN